MILPNCRHDKTNTPSATGWVITCKEHFEAAMRANLMSHLDAKKMVLLDSEVRTLRDQLQKALSDLHDMQMARRTTFLRCECGRLREKGLTCRGCGT